MIEYIKKNYKKVKEDALSKAIYDLCKYLLGLLVTYILLNKIPISNVIGEIIQTKFQISYLQIFVTVIIIIMFTVLIQFLIYRKYFALIKKDLHTDELTGLLNKRALDKELKEILSVAKKDGKNISIILMDIDDFKKFNTNFGQNVADEVLKKIGVLLKSDCRITDRIYRQHVKGDEFVIIAGETTLDNAIIAANRKRELIAKTGIQIDNVDEPFMLTVCCGVVQLNHNKDDENLILERAHSAMLMAKAIKGKNQTKSLI